MDETMIERHNAKVKPNDVVYMLGDVVINRKSLHHVSRLNGKKRLVRGNHDIFKDDVEIMARAMAMSQRADMSIADQWLPEATAALAALTGEG
jgi:calcineurin-like phosphoesterase family protein